MHPTAGPKQASQEQLSPEGVGATYNQIKYIIACKQHGIDWNSVIVQSPAVYDPLLDIGDNTIPF